MQKMNMIPEEVSVMSQLYTAWKNAGGKTKKITQNQIAKADGWMGAHTKHERSRSNETTLRKVRQVIRDLRINYGAPILSDRDGYWIPQTEKEVKEYLDRIEIEAKAQAKAWFETYKAMDKVLGVRSEYFESQVQDKLF